jgi:type II secretory pathway pseudopilin PulG
MLLPPTPSRELFQLSPTAPETTSTATPTVTPTPGEKLQEWSSLIGIVTAIVGNVLIALALNVQRYAHTQLHKQRALVRRRARAAMKRAQSSNQSGHYGAADGNQGSTNGNGNGNGNTVHNGGSDGDDGRESDPLNSFYHSGASTEAGDDDLDEDKASSSYLKSPYWWLGQILITLGEMGNFLAYGFAPASIVSPLGVVALISNCLIAPLMFHERFRQRDFWGVVIAVGGVVTVVLSANTEETKLKPGDVWGAITTLAFQIYLVVTIVFIIILMWASPRFGRRTILIDLGLVGLFGMYTQRTWFGCIDSLQLRITNTTSQAVTRHSQPRVSLRCSLRLYGGPSPHPSPTSCSSFSSVLQSCRSATSTGLSSASTRPRSFLSSSSCSLCASSWAAPSSTATLRRPRQNKQASLSAAVFSPSSVSSSLLVGEDTVRMTRIVYLRPMEWRKLSDSWIRKGMRKTCLTDTTLRIMLQTLVGLASMSERALPFQKIWCPLERATIMFPRCTLPTRKARRTLNVPRPRR